MHRPSARLRRSVSTFTMLAVIASITIAGALPAQAVNATQSVIVNPDPANFTPNVLNGQINAFAQIGNTIYAGGIFTQVQASTGGPIFSRSNLFSFDASTGAINTLRSDLRQHREGARGRPRREPARRRVLQLGERRHHRSQARQAEPDDRRADHRLQRREPERPGLGHHDGGQPAHRRRPVHARSRTSLATASPPLTRPRATSTQQRELLDHRSAHLGLHALGLQHGRRARTVRSW